MAKRKLTTSRRIYLKYKTSEKRRKLKIKCIEYKGGKCQFCNYNKSVNSLEFHHIDQASKDFNISDYMSKTFAKIKLELDKCILLCKNCHLSEHERIRAVSREENDSAAYRIYLKRKIIKEKLVNYKGGSCIKCSYKQSNSALCFHHIDKQNKLFSINGHHLCKKWEIVKQELDKCLLLCGNCHGEIHSEEHEKMMQDSYIRMRQVVPQKQTKTSVKKNCFHCNNEIVVYKSRIKERNFCSRSCRDAVLNKKKE
jgi:hypothetical protein